MKWLLFFLILLASDAHCHPSQIIIFRHGEKVRADGFIEDLNAELNNQGQQRAAYLVSFLLQKKIIDQDKEPIAAFYVPHPKKKIMGKSYTYIRCAQTILPLYNEANAYHIETEGKPVFFNNHFAYNKAEKVLDDVLKNDFNGKTVVICWEHLHIPDLLKFHFQNLKPELPHMGEDRFDLVWVIRFQNNEPTPYVFVQRKTFNSTHRENEPDQFIYH